MIVTKSELARKLNVNPSRITNLLNDGLIIENKEGKINLNHPLNKRYLNNHKENAVKYNPYKDIPKEKQINNQENDEESEDLENKTELEKKLLTEKIEKEKKSNELLGIKIAVNKKELVETDCLNRILIQSYEFFFKNLLEYPPCIVDQIINIVKSDEENAKEKIIELLTKGLKGFLDDGIEQTEKAMSKFYES